MIALRHAYVRPMAAVGRRPFLANRYARFAFLTTLKELERRLGAPTEPVTTTLHSGTRFVCHLTDNVEAELFYLGSYAATEIDTVARNLRPGEVFLDVGAHVGLFSVEIARRLGPAGRVIAFEPSPDSALALRRNAAENGAGDIIEIVEMGLGERFGTVPLRTMRGHPHDAGRRSIFADGPVAAYANMHPLDELVANGRVRFERGLHAVKIDVEGAEAAAIRGMRQTLLEHRPRLVLVETVEANLQRAGSSVAEVVNLMRQLGYAPETPGTKLDTAFVPEPPR